MSKSPRMTAEEFERTQAEINARVKSRNAPIQTVTKSSSSAAATKKKGSKWRNKPTKYKGVTYHSEAEATYAAYLDQLLAAKQVLSWERQPKFLMMKQRSVTSLVLAVEIQQYTADFLIVRPDGSRYVVDIKGVEKQRDKEVRAMWAQFGPYDLHVIYSDHTLVVPAGVPGGSDEKD